MGVIVIFLLNYMFYHQHLNSRLIYNIYGTIQINFKLNELVEWGGVEHCKMKNGCLYAAVLLMSFHFEKPSLNLWEHT